MSPHRLMDVLNVNTSLDRLITTPDQITEQIRDFANRIVPSGTVVTVPVRPANACLSNECFRNLPPHVAANGGSIQHGWTIWELPKLVFIAEFHAVWRTRDNELIDVTPKTEATIAFLPDPIRTFAGSKVPNQVENILGDHSVQRWIWLTGEVARLTPIGPFLPSSLLIKRTIDAAKAAGDVLKLYEREHGRSFK